MSAVVSISSSVTKPDRVAAGDKLSARAMLLLQAALWSGMFLVFFASPVVQINDAKYSMLTAESIIHNGTPDLSSYSIPHYEADLPFNSIRGNHPYQLMRANGRLLYGFPHGTSILSLPLVAILDAMGISPASRDGQFNLASEVMDQKMIAALLMASLVIVFLRTAMLLLDWRASSIIAIGAGLGTQVWSTASRGMWSHSWEMTLGGLVVYLLLDAEVRRISLRPILLATLLAWMFFVRPTAAGPIACVTFYVFVCRRREFASVVMVGVLWIAAIALYSIGIFGSVFPSYYAQLWAPDFHWFALAIFGSLFSPSRGLLVYCPVLAVVLYLLMRNWHALRSKPLALLALGSSASILLVTAAHFDWWGGNCYGPRYLSDAIPWMVLLAILAIAAIPARSRTLRNPPLSLGVALLLVGIAIHGHGALSIATMEWNERRPLPGVMLEWSRPQFLAGSFFRKSDQR